MAINPMKLLELKNLWNAFTRRHPKFPQFISAVQQAGISEGTVIEVQITIPDGRTFTSNLKVQQEDIEAVKSLPVNIWLNFIWILQYFCTKKLYFYRKYCII